MSDREMIQIDVAASEVPPMLREPVLWRTEILTGDGYLTVEGREWEGFRWAQAFGSRGAWSEARTMAYRLAECADFLIWVVAWGSASAGSEGGS